MKLPREISGKELAKVLKKYGYEITRQSGSHIRFTTTMTPLKVHVDFCKIIEPEWRKLCFASV